MNDTTPRGTRIWGLGAAALLAAALVAACGGGGSSTGGTAAAQSYTSGPISGFGSIIVNGVRFDDSSARVEDEDGNSGDDKKARLQLGTMVEVQSGGIDDSTGRATATTIRFGSEIVGKVTAATADSFTVLDQVVDVKAETVFEGDLTLATLKDRTVEVHALFDAATGHYVATRVEAEDSPNFYKLRGLVSQLDTTARTFQIGAAVISYADIAAADLPANFGNGAKVRVRLETTQATSPFVAVTIRSGVRKVEDHEHARLIGTVTTYTSAADFEVNGIKVDATSARVEGTVAAGVRIAVRGTAANGVIVATEVKVLMDGDDRIRGVELHGTITGAPDTTAKTFVLRGVTVSWDSATVFKDGTAAQLADGARVEVKGVLSTDRKTLAARLIEFES